MTYMKTIFLKTLPIILLGVLASCSGDMKPREYIDWVEDGGNGLKAKKNTGSVSYILQYEPAEYKALKSAKPETINKTRLAANREKFSSLHHFLLKVKPKAHKFESDEALIEYLAYGLEDKIRFIRGQDTLKRTVMYHMETPAGVKPYYNILLAYPRTESQADLELIIKSNKLDTNTVNFGFSRSALSGLPQIDTRME